MRHDHCRLTPARSVSDDAAAGAAGGGLATGHSALDTAVFEEPELGRASLAAAFSDLVPEPLDREPSPGGTLHGGRLGATAVFAVAGSPQTVRRTSTAVRHSPSDMLKVCVPLLGRATV